MDCEDVLEMIQLNRPIDPPDYDNNIREPALMNTEDEGGFRKQGRRKMTPTEKLRSLERSRKIENNRLKKRVYDAKVGIVNRD